MSTDGLAYSEQLPVPRRPGPAFGQVGPPPEIEATKEGAGPLDRRTEVVLGLAIVIPVVAAYGAIAYGLYHAAGAIL